MFEGEQGLIEVLIDIMTDSKRKKPKYSAFVKIFVLIGLLVIVALLIIALISFL